MKKKIIRIIIIIVLVLGIGAGVVYKSIEKDVTGREIFYFNTDTNGSNDTVSYDEHFFYGKILEVSSSYIIVEPNENEEERKSSDKFSVELKNDNTTYKVGDNVKITYNGGINESYPAQIGTTKIELESVVKDNVLKKINSIAENGPVTSSNPFDYINASQKVYDELLNNPEETFRYAISDLIQTNANNRNGLINYIEAILCSKINTNFKYDFESASDYLEKYKEFLLKCDCIYNEYDIYAKSLLK